jgi:hypothetical protein
MLGSSERGRISALFPAEWDAYAVITFTKAAGKDSGMGSECYKSIRTLMQLAGPNHHMPKSEFRRSSRTIY